jgi:ADP-ribose pyrophosphatase YjhB (NUDIX family)
MNKDFRKAISLVFWDKEKVLVLRRSELKESFPGAWSIPSTYIHSDETLQETANRLAKRKLNIEDVVLSEVPLGISPIVDRGEYDFVMTDYLVKNYSGNITFNTEEYTEMRWVTPVELLQLINVENGGQMGECTRVFLTSEQLL